MGGERRGEGSRLVRRMAEVEEVGECRGRGKQEGREGMFGGKRGGRQGKGKVIRRG